MPGRVFLSVLAFIAIWQGAAASADPGPLFMGFYESWTELPVGNANFTKLAQMPPSLDIVAIGFVKPDLTFDGVHLASTGLQVPFDAPMMAEAIKALRTRNPKVKVLLSVGGAGWANFSLDPLTRLVKALGVDGIDLDYEPAVPNCANVRTNDRTQIECAVEDTWKRIITLARAAFPRPALLSAEGWSVGAYGEGGFARDLPPSPWTGSMLWLSREAEAKQLDIVAVMAYDVGPTFDPERAFAAYRTVWAGPLLLGIGVPGADSREPPMPLPRIKELATHHAKDPMDGIMLYSVTEEVPNGPSLRRPDGEMAAKAICEGLGRKECD